MKLSLFTLTNQVKILGFISLRIFMPAADGRVLEFVEEAYVIPGMNVPVLLGEDFQVNYKISILRSVQGTHLSINQPREQYSVPGHSTPPLVKNFQVQPRHPPEIRNHATYLAASRDPGLKPKHIIPMTHLLQAATDMRISVQWVARVPVEGPTTGHDEWFME
jgi:hypothetical protein